MLRVLHVMTVPLSLTFLRGQAERMREGGYQLIAATGPGPEAAEFSAAEGVPVHVLPIQRAIAPFADTRAIAGLRRLIDQVQPDFVHASTPKGGLIGVSGARLAGVPVIYTMRGMPLLTASGPKARLLWSAELASCRGADEVICVSGSLRREAIARGLVSAAHSHVLGPGSGQGVDTGRFRPPSPAERASARSALGLPGDALAYVFVGRFARDKGIAELVEAFVGLAEADPHAHLLLVGEEDARDPGGAALSPLREHPRVHFLGFRSDVERVFHAADVHVFPTYREGFPNVPLEAGACGLPTVASRAIGCVDAIAEGRTGLLVPVRDAGALRDAMARYAADPALRAAHGARARDHVERHFERGAVLGRLRDFYDRFARERELPRRARRRSRRGPLRLLRG